MSDWRAHPRILMLVLVITAGVVVVIIVIVILVFQLHFGSAFRLRFHSQDEVFRDSLDRSDIPPELAPFGGQALR